MTRGVIVDDRRQETLLQIGEHSLTLTSRRLFRIAVDNIQAVSVNLPLY
jgi:hypothetical protein